MVHTKKSRARKAARSAGGSIGSRTTSRARGRAGKAKKIKGKSFSQRKAAARKDRESRQANFSLRSGEQAFVKPPGGTQEANITLRTGEEAFVSPSGPIKRIPRGVPIRKKEQTRPGANQTSASTGKAVVGAAIPLGGSTTVLKGVGGKAANKQLFETRRGMRAPGEPTFKVKGAGAGVDDATRSIFKNPLTAPDIASKSKFERFIPRASKVTSGGKNALKALEFGALLVGPGKFIKGGKLIGKGAISLGNKVGIKWKKLPPTQWQKDYLTRYGKNTKTDRLFKDYLNKNIPVDASTAGSKIWKSNNCERDWYMDWYAYDR